MPSCICCNNPTLDTSPAIIAPFIAHKLSSGKSSHYPCNSLYCRVCGLIFLDVRYTDNDLLLLYDDYRGESYVTLRDKYEPGYRALNEKLLGGDSHIPEVEKFLSPHLKFPVSILDWGGDTGKNTPFKNNNKLLHIYDISNIPPGVDHAQKIKREALSRTQYDLIVCSNVLEHVPYPQETILDIQKTMDKDTLLYIEVPHEPIMRSSGRSLQVNYWHEHVNYFTESSLKALVARCGLSSVGFKYLSPASNPYNFFSIACKLTPARRE